METLYHICPRDVWEDTQGDYRAPSLASEGFIHCSTQGQLAGTAARFFRGQRDLVLLVIDRTRVHASVRDDDIGGGHYFAHIYGPLNRDAVVEVREFTMEGLKLSP